jgi:hypothetical protein
VRDEVVHRRTNGFSCRNVAQVLDQQFVIKSGVRRS